MNDHAKSAAIRYAQERAGKGVCTGCGLELPDRESKWPKCTPCHRTHRQRCGESIRSGKKRRYHKKLAAGTCSSEGCKETAEEGRKQCRPHLDMNNAATARYKAKKRKS